MSFLRSSFAALLLFACALTVSAGAESPFPYRLNTKTDILLTASGLGFMATGVIASNSYSKPDLATIDDGDIPSFDRFAHSYYNEDAGTVSDITLFGAVLTPVALLPRIAKEKADRFDRLIVLGAMYCETVVITEGMTQCAKRSFGRYRPYVYNNDAPIDRRLSKDARHSMWSRHVAGAFASAVFAGCVVSNTNPRKRLVPAVWATGLTLASSSAVLRIAAGEHFPSDVLAGAAAGSFVGWLVPKLHKKIATGGITLSPVPMDRGVGLMVMW